MSSNFRGSLSLELFRRLPHPEVVEDWLEVEILPDPEVVGALWEEALVLSHVCDMCEASAGLAAKPTDVRGDLKTQLAVKFKFLKELWEGACKGVCGEDMLALESITISASGASQPTTS